jgi:hypothetical protein
MNNPAILKGTTSQDESNLLISEDVIASACLAYLRQEKYSSLLQNASMGEEEQWKTQSGEDIVNHHLLRYSSKYWDKHLDEAKETPALRVEVERYVFPSNYLQLEHLKSHETWI